MGDKYVQVGGTFTATVAVEGRTGPGESFIPVGSPTSVTAPGFIKVEEIVSELRVVVSGHTSGTPTARMGALALDGWNG